MNAIEDLRLVRTFVRIAETGSISSAARAMDVPQPTVSRQLQQLEVALGAVLIRRDTHRLSLTEAGHRLLEDGRDLLARAAAASERLRIDLSSPRGHLRIVSVLDSGQWIVSRVLAGFRELNTEMTAELHLINRPSNFTQEGFDCGILVGAITDRSVAARKIGSIKRILAAAPAVLEKLGHPKRPADLGRLPWMGILQPHFKARDQVKLSLGARHVTVRLKPALVMDSVTALREALLVGAGVALQPLWLINAELRTRRLVPILPHWRIEPADIFVVFPTGRIPAAVRAFVDYAAKAIPRLIAEKETTK